MLTNEQVGLYRDNGVHEPTRSALSGKPLAPGYAQISLGKGRFVRVAGGEWRALSGAEKQAMQAEWSRGFDDVDIVKAARDSAEPDFDGMTFTDLKAYASDNDIDISGRRSAEDVRNAIRGHRVSARFAEPSSAIDAGGSLATGDVPVTEGGI